MTRASLDEYPRPSAMSEPELLAAYGGLPPSALRDPAVSEGLAPRDLQPDQPSAEDHLLCMEPECAHASAGHGPDGCAECPCRGFDPLGPPDEYDRWRDDQLTDRWPMAL